MRKRAPNDDHIEEEVEDATSKNDSEDNSRSRVEHRNGKGTTGDDYVGNSDDNGGNGGGDDGDNGVMKL